MEAHELARRERDLVAAQSAIGIAFRAAKRSFDITAAAVGTVRVHILSRIPEMYLAKPAFRAVCA